MQNSSRRIVGRYKNLVHLTESIKNVIINGFPAGKLYIIGITGTDGKTTTSHLTYEFLIKGGYKTALISTVGAYIKGKVLDTGFHVTTPDAKLLQPLLKQIVNKDVKYLVLETTSHGLDQHRTLGCNFKVGVLTNVTHEHLDYHRNFESYRRSKAKLFRGVDYAVLNKDDESFNFFKSKLKKDCKIISYSMDKKAVLSISSINLNTGGMDIEIKERGKTHKLTSTLMGEYNASNILAACGAARVVGVEWNAISQALKEFKGVKGRMEIIDKGQPFTVLVDFAHTPNALESVLLSLRRVKNDKKLIVVFGCAGERDILKRPMMGEIAARLANVSIFTAEDPRRENVEDIIASMVEGANRIGALEFRKGNGNFLKKNMYLTIPDRGEAIRCALQQIASSGDIVVICGKGHEKSLAFGDKEIPWSDQKAVEHYLQ